MKRIYSEIFPHFAINGILFCKEREEINQEYDRFSRNIPTANTNLQAVVLQRMFFPCDTQIITLDKQRIFLSYPKIRANKEKLILVYVMQSLCPSGQDRIYTPYLVAYFPTRFEDIIWG